MFCELVLNIRIRGSLRSNGTIGERAAFGLSEVAEDVLQYCMT